MIIMGKSHYQARHGIKCIDKLDNVGKNLLSIIEDSAAEWVTCWEVPPEAGRYCNNIASDVTAESETFRGESSSLADKHQWHPMWWLSLRQSEWESPAIKSGRQAPTAANVHRHTTCIYSIFFFFFYIYIYVASVYVKLWLLFPCYLHMHLSM